MPVPTDMKLVVQTSIIVYPTTALTDASTKSSFTDANAT